MQSPRMFSPQPVANQTTSLPAYLPVPGFGILSVNSYIIHGEQSVLVDTGLAALREDYLSALRSVIDPTSLQWIWITHADPDHIGNLSAVLAEAPQAKILTSYVGMGKMGMHGLPVDRCHLLNPGQRLNVGDRNLTAVSPPTFDAPETLGFFDDRTGAFFSSDCFGALMEQPAETTEELSAEALRQGCIRWATVDAPWLHLVDEKPFKQELNLLKKLGSSMVLSSHLPPARNMIEPLLSYLNEALRAPRFLGPDQAQLEKLMVA